ncbi:hypothetical protein CTI14_30375 [Methylobacterium radiotolerans]|nr:hypothetical protein CTI14_30375 [Methylobacterium radiotolerans]
MRALGVDNLELLTNNPDKRTQLERMGIQVSGCRLTGVFPNEHNKGYLLAKALRTQHRIELGQTRSDEAIRPAAPPGVRRNPYTLGRSLGRIAGCMAVSFWNPL